MKVQIFCFLFPSSSLGTQLCRSSSFGEPVPKPELGNEGEDHFEILARSIGRQRISAVAEGKLELPGQGVPKLELGNEGKERVMSCRSRLAGDPGQQGIAGFTGRGQARSYR
jgi:hypothetical protein